MKNFHINPEGYQEPRPEPHEYFIGTEFRFETISGRIKAAVRIPVLAV